MRRLVLSLIVLLSAAVVSPAVSLARSPDATPGVRPTPFVIRGVRFDPADLAASPVPVQRRGVLLSGAAEHGATARLTAPMRYRAPPLVDETAPVGTVFHRVEFIYGADEPVPALAVWCSTLGQKTIFGGNSPPLCFIEGDELLRGFTSSEGRGWLVTSGLTAGAAQVRADRFEYEISPTSLMGPLTVRLELADLRRDRLTLRLVAQQERQSAVVAVFHRPIVAGMADLPLWSHSLRLTADGDRVSPVLTADGDGRGPYDP